MAFFYDSFTNIFNEISFFFFFKPHTDKQYARLLVEAVSDKSAISLSLFFFDNDTPAVSD